MTKPYDRGGLRGSTWVERVRDMWRNSYGIAAVYLEQARERAEKAERERDEAVARAEAAERELADPYSQANQDSQAWTRVASHPALRMDLLPEADHTHAGGVFERITWLAETAEAAEELMPAPAVSRISVEQAIRAAGVINKGYVDGVADEICALFGIEAEQTVDPVEKKAAELHEVAQGDGPFIVWEALMDQERNMYRRMAAHVLGQEDRHVDQ